MSGEGPGLGDMSASCVDTANCLTFGWRAGDGTQPDDRGINWRGPAPWRGAAGLCRESVWPGSGACATANSDHVKMSCITLA